MSNSSSSSLYSNAFSLHLLSQNLNIDFTKWIMQPGEQMALTYFLQNLRPSVAIEIGTALGGSLQIISHFSSKVYALDADPEVPKRLEGKYPNAEYLIGNSSEILPLLLAKLAQENAKLSFILVDGDHEAEGVKKDIQAILKYRPRVPLYILMHDSFNPECRRGIYTAAWESCPYVHAVEMDFLVGSIHQRGGPPYYGEGWSGLGLAIMLPEPRDYPLVITNQADLTLQLLASEKTYYKEYKRLKRNIISERIIEYVSKKLYKRKSVRFLLNQPLVRRTVDKTLCVMRATSTAL